MTPTEPEAASIDMAKEQAKKDDTAKGAGRPSVWAVNKSVSPTRAPKKLKAQSFYVVLTSWSGARLAIRYTTGKQFPMEPADFGGTYLIFANGMIYVQESRAEINGKIHRRLQSMQAAWQAA